MLTGVPQPEMPAAPAAAARSRPSVCDFFSTPPKEWLWFVMFFPAMVAYWRLGSQSRATLDGT